MVIYVRSRSDLEHQIVLMHAEDWSIRALVRHFGIGRNTIRCIIRSHREQRDRGHDVLAERKIARRNSKLDAFKPVVQRLLKKHPDITGVRVYEELEEAGFSGGRTIVTDYLRTIRPRPKKEPVVRFETPAGYQGQMDWSPYAIDFTRAGRQKVLCFSYSNLHSR
jgi:transposase